MVKKNKLGFIKAACVMLALTMLAACVLSDTMAKYTSSGTASGLTLTIAKWDVEVGGETLGSTEIDLSSAKWTIKQEGSVADATFVEENMIAPGTWGYVPIAVENLSDVDAVIKVSGIDTFKPTSGVDSAGLTFKVMVIDEDREPDSYEDGYDVTDIAEIGVGIDKGGDVVNIYVCYQWEFGESGDYDTDDTAMGKASAEAYKAGGERTKLEFDSKLTITAEQSDGTVG